jgi:hypothetical protein
MKQADSFKYMKVGMIKYKKYILIIGFIWLSLFSIFWATAHYAYNGFIVSLITIVLIAYFIRQYYGKWSNSKTS